MNIIIYYRILNVKAISIKDRDMFYRSSKDHSKWAIGTHEVWTCIGDINRAVRLSIYKILIILRK